MVRSSLKYLVVLFVLVGMVANAGHFVKENTSMYLDGKVHVRFDTLKIGWSRDHQSVDNIRYRITCLAGEATLNNVEYLDTAVDGKENIRWTQAADKMNVNFSARANKLEKSHIVRVYRELKVKIAPYNIATAKVRFHIRASGRDYKVTWEPKSGKMYAAW